MCLLITWKSVSLANLSMSLVSIVSFSREKEIVANNDKLKFDFFFKWLSNLYVDSANQRDTASLSYSHVTCKCFK